MKETRISTREFERRMIALCLGGVGPALPRRWRDRHIFLRSVALLLGDGRVYTEPEINRLLTSWLDAVGPDVRLDHVSLRRHLVDEGYVVRDPAGRTYEVRSSQEQRLLFEPGVDNADPLAAVRTARAEREERARRHWARWRARRPG